MHALPRRLALDEKNHRTDAGRRRCHAGSADAGNNWKQYRGPNDLRIRRGLRLADAKFCRQIPRRIRRSGAETVPASIAAGTHARGAGGRATNSDHAAGARSRMGKSRHRRNYLNMNLESRKPGSELGNRHLTDRIIAAAIRIHKELGPGFLENMYEEALAIELAGAGISFERRKLLPILYREHLIGQHRLDLVVEGMVIVELKAISALEDI